MENNGCKARESVTLHSLQPNLIRLSSSIVLSHVQSTLETLNQIPLSAKLCSPFQFCLTQPRETSYCIAPEEFMRRGMCLLLYTLNGCNLPPVSLPCQCGGRHCHIPTFSLLFFSTFRVASIPRSSLHSGDNNGQVHLAVAKSWEASCSLPLHSSNPV